MTRNRRFRSSRTVAGTVGAVALAGLLALSGCGSGQIAQTANQTNAINGTGAAAGPIGIRNLFVVYPRQAAAPGVAYAPGGAAPVAFGMVNTAAVPDRLVRVSSPIATGGTITGDATLPSNVSLIAGGETAVPGVRTVVVELTGLTQPVRAGVTVPITFTFERAPAKTVQVPVGAPPEGTGEPEREETKIEAGAPPEAPAAPEAPASSEAPAPAPAAPAAPATPAPAPEGGR